MEELNSIMEQFAASGWDFIAVPAQQWLDGKSDRDALTAVIKPADQECGGCAVSKSVRASIRTPKRNRIIVLWKS